jgi:hypothetical protein
MEVQPGARICDRLRTGKETAVNPSRMTNPPHPGDFILTQIIELFFRLCRG